MHKSTLSLRARAGMASAFERPLLETLDDRRMMAVIAWDGGPTGDGTNWHDAVNWVGNVLPGALDDAQLGASGTNPVISISTAVTVNSVTSTRNAGMSGGSLTLAAASSFATGTTFTLSGGTLNGAGNLTVDGSLVWSGGTMSGSGRTIVSASGSAMLNGGSRTLSRTLEIDGSASWTAGTFFFSTGTVQNDGLFSIDGAVSTANLGGVNAFNNTGIFQKIGLTAATFATAAFNNTGTLEVNGGVLSLNVGGTSSGDATINKGTLELAGVHALSGPITVFGTLRETSGTTTFTGALTGPGTVAITGGTLTLNSNATFAGGLQHSAGILDGTGTVSFAGLSTWDGGTMGGTGRTIIASGGSLTMGGGSRTLARTLEIDGTGSWSAGTWFFSGGTVQSDNAFLVDGNVSTSNLGGANAFNNNGTFTKSGTGVATFNSVSFSNTSVLNVIQGTLFLNNGGTSPGSENVVAGATLELGGTHALSGSVTANGTLRVSSGTTTLSGTLTDAGLLDITGGTARFNSSVTFDGGLQLSGGALDGSGTVRFNGASSWTGGSMSGAGRTIMGPGSSLALGGGSRTLARVLEIDGTATWSAGTWFFNAGTLQNDGTFTVDAAVSTANLGGVNTFNNNGTVVRTGSGTATFSSVVFNNVGTLNVNQGTLDLNQGGTSSGPMTIAGAGSLGLGGTHALSGSVTVTGSLAVNSGTTTMSGSLAGVGLLSLVTGTLTLAVDVNYDGPVAISGAALNGAGNVTLNGITTWSGGSMSGAGRTIIGAAGVLTMNGGSRTLARVLEVDGTTTWTAGTWFFNAGTFQNDGVFSVDQTVSSANLGGVNTFNNNATFTKSGAGTTTTLSQVTFNNAATGTVTIAGGSELSTAPFNNNGSITLGAGALLSVSGVFTQTASGSISTEFASASEYGRIAATGVANIAGTLTTSTAKGYAPVLFDRFNVASGSSVVGTFATVNLPSENAPTRKWIVVYHANRVEVVYTSTADWNEDGIVNSTDVSDFINDWFLDQVKGTTVTDFNVDGVSNSTDVSDFINLWFADVSG